MYSLNDSISIIQPLTTDQSTEYIEAERLLKKLHSFGRN